jgi:hypothetical protein
MRLDMVRFTSDDELRGAEFVETDLAGARFRFAQLSEANFSQSYLPRAVMRGVDLTDADIDGMVDGLVVNGVEVGSLIEAELNRRYPGREHARSELIDEQRASYEAALRTWDALLDRAAALPEGTVDVSVDGEWSLAQTMRHLVLATDGWVRFGVQGIDDAFHPIGIPFSEYDAEAPALGVDLAATPTWTEVLAVRADRVAQVRALYDALSGEEFAGPARRLPPWEGEGRTLPVWRCLGVVVAEEWEHHRFAERDLARLEAARHADGAGATPT